MSYIDIKDYIKSGKDLLEKKEYWGALSIALSIPSICSRIEFAEQKEQYMNWKWIDKKDHSKGQTPSSWKDQECYVDWCKKMLKNDSWLQVTFGKNYCEAIYELRCIIFHTGTMSIFKDNKEIVLSFDEYATTKSLYQYRIVSIFGICQTLFDAFQSWIQYVDCKKFEKTLIFYPDKESDRQLLEKIINDEKRMKETNNNA